LIKSVNSFIEPIFKFDKIILGPPPPSINCDIPPQLINITYRNVSNIPIKLIVKSHDVYFGGLPINVASRPESQTDYLVLAPGEPWGVTRGISNEVRDMMRNKYNQFNPPFLTLSLKCTISTLNGQTKYDVHLEHRIGIDCNLYSSQYNCTTIRESYIPIKDD
jgi:hypothetical protein